MMPRTAKSCGAPSRFPNRDSLVARTWPQGDQWKTGGGSVWVTGTYDPETNLAFWGTGNGGPWMGDQRPGDNLYTSSVIALDGKTGEIKGHFQYHPKPNSWGLGRRFRPQCWARLSAQRQNNPRPR